MHDMKTLVYFTVVGIAVNVYLNLLLVGNMLRNGLALATSISADCSTILLYLGLKKKYNFTRIMKEK